MADLRSTGTTYYDTLGHELATFVYHEPGAAIGLSLDCRLGLGFELRTVLAEARFPFGGGAGLVLPKLGAELTYVAPVPWRMRPYFWCGAYLASFSGSESSDTIRSGRGPDYQVRLGLGARYPVRQNIDVCLDIQVWSAEGYTEFVPGYWVVRDRFSSTALEVIRLGVLFGVGR